MTYSSPQVKELRPPRRRRRSASRQEQDSIRPEQSSARKEPGSGPSTGQVKIISGWHAGDPGRISLPRPVRFNLVFAARTLPLRMLYVVVGLMAAHAILAYVNYEIQKLPWLLLQLFDLDEENNLPSWYSGTALFVTAVTLWLCAREKKASNDVWSRQWYLLTVGFFFLAVDEIAGLHETLNSLVDLSWAIPGGIIAVTVGLVFTPFLMRLPRRTAFLFVVSGALYVGGAVVVELIAAPMNSDSLAYYMMTLTEEGMEMLGVVLFLYALLSYMCGQEGNRLQVGASLIEAPS